MNELKQKLIKLQELIKANFQLASPKQPVSPKQPQAPQPSIPSMGQQPQAPKAGQATSKKDPKKVAEQLKDPDIKNQAMKEAKKMKEGVSFNKSGQWSIQEINEDEKV